MDADFCIAGAGCAGLSLAVHLVEAGLGERTVLLLEPRREYRRDRTWCFWDVREHPFESAVVASWRRWKVRAGGEEIVRESSRYAYRYLPADAFYAEALRRLEEHPGVTLRRGVEVRGWERDAGGVTARTSEGPVRARRGFDSRPPAGVDRPVPGGLVQHFLGEVVETDAPAFDPGTATLMDFDVDRSRRIHFVYLLPLDERRALVEDTYFAGRPFADELYEASIRRYLGERHGVTRWRTLHRERGAIPMRPARDGRARRGDAVMRIGVRGGLARPSTGYAFLAIQRDSAELARRLVRGSGGARAPRPRSRSTAFLDRVFLSYIARHPERAPGLFLRMFRDVEPDVLIRFLFDEGDAGDSLRVMRALPALPLMGEAVRSSVAPPARPPDDRPPGEGGA